MTKLILFLSTKGPRQFSVDFEYDYDDRSFARNMKNAIDNYCTNNCMLSDKSVSYKYVIQDTNFAYVIAECNANTLEVYPYAYEISEHYADVYEVIYKHQYIREGLYFWIGQNKLNVNLLDNEWDKVLDVELAEIRSKLVNTKMLPCNRLKLQGVEEFLVYKVNADKTCSVYKSIPIKDPKIYKTIDDLWDEFLV